MSKIYFTSDTHLGHANVMKHDKAPFASLEERDTAILKNITDMLSDGDILYHLGDVAWSVGALNRFLEATKRFQVHLIRGNHDDKIAWRHRDKFASAREAHYFRHNNEKYYLHHYACLVWRNSHHGAYHLFGHSHGCLKNPVGRSMDVGIPANNYKPVALETVLEILTEKPTVFHHQYEKNYTTKNIR